MTPRDLLLVVGLAGVALGITLVDLLWSGWRHRRCAARLQASRGQAAGDVLGDAADANRRSELWNRLSAIEAAGAESPPGRGDR